MICSVAPARCMGALHCLCLLLVMLPVVPAAAAGEATVAAELDRLNRHGYALIEDDYFEPGISSFSRALELSPRDPEVAYNLACAHALQGDADQAMRWLQQAVDWGYDSADQLAHLSRDPDLESLRQDPRYTALVQTLTLTAGPALSADEQALASTLDLVVMVEGEQVIAGAPTGTFGAAIAFGDDGKHSYLVTANHVVRRGTEPARGLRIMTRGQPGQWRAAQLMPEFDEAMDVAVLRVATLAAPESSFCALPVGSLGAINAVQRGLPVFPVGNPGAHWGMPVAPDRLAQVAGDELSFQSTFIARGHSGGALLSAQGKLLGLLTRDAPPYGVAVRLDRVLSVLKGWGYPVQLHNAASGQSTALLAAVEAGNTPEVQRLLAGCINPNTATARGWTALHEAAWQGEPDIAEVLLNAGAESHSWAYDSAFEGREDILFWSSPLHVAARSDSAGVAGSLLARGVQPDLYDFYQNHGDSLFGMNAPHIRGSTALHEASAAGAARVVAVLLKAGANVELRDHDKARPIDLAAQHDQAQVMQILLQGGATVAGEGRGPSPVDLAAQTGASEALKVLLDNGADPNARVGSQFALHLAARGGHIKAASVLLDHGADPNVAGYLDRTPLHHAAEQYGSVEMAALLIEHGADLKRVDQRRHNPGQLAIIENRPDVLAVLLQAGAPVPSLHDATGYRRNAAASRLLIAAGAPLEELNRDGRTPLHVAAADGQTDAVRDLLQAGAKVNARTPDTRASSNMDKRTPLGLAVEGGHLEAVKLLVQGGADLEIVDDSERTPLHIAAYENHFDIVLLLVAAGADVQVLSGRYTNRRETPLIIVASRTRDIAPLRALLEAGAPVDGRDDVGETALHRAAARGWLDGTRLLLQHDAQVDAKDRLGATALHEAARPGHVETARALLDAGADPAAQSLAGTSALHRAATLRDPALAQLLLDAGAPIDTPDGQGNTALHLAARSSNGQALIRLFLARGANATLLNDKGQTALEVATDSRRFDNATLLQQASPQG